jgi:polyisoprenoid-binding protein YceI
MTTAMRTADGTYELDEVHSTVQFAVRHVGVSTYRATFDDVAARVVISDGSMELQASTFVGSVSITEPPEFREHVLNGDDFFAADKHPVIAFRSTTVELGPDGKAMVRGDLTIRDLRRPVTATGTLTPPVEDPFGNVRIGLELEGTIDRRDWGMVWQMPLPNGGDALAWDVEITARLELVRQP